MKSMDLPDIASAQARREGQVQSIDITSSESLSKKVVRGGFWVFALRFTNRGLGFIRTIILARLLAPSDFGLLGMAMLAISTLETFSEIGFQTALIQKKRNVQSYLDTAWTVSVIRGTILFLILFSSAPVIAKFFNSPQALLVIRVIAISTLLSGCRNIGVLFFRKRLDFDKQFVYELCGTLVNLAVAIPLAFVLRNVWALVCGGVAANFARLVMSYILQPYRPRLKIGFSQFSELFGFGKWLLGSGILIFLITQGDDILVGKMLGVAALGLYQMAYMISNLAATEITHVVSQVTFPAYSKLQGEQAELRNSYLKVIKVTSLLSFPLAGFILLIGPQFTVTILGSKWAPMIPTLQTLCFYGMFRSIGATMGPILYGVGKPEIQTKLSSIQLILMGLIIYPMTHRWGILGTALAVIIPYMLALGLILRETRNILKFSYREFLLSIFPPFVAICLAGTGVFFANSFFWDKGNIGAFIALLLLFMLLYLVAIVFWDRKIYSILKPIHEILNTLGFEGCSKTL